MTQSQHPEPLHGPVLLRSQASRQPFEVNLRLVPLLSLLDVLNQALAGLKRLKMA